MNRFGAITMAMLVRSILLLAECCTIFSKNSNKRCSQYHKVVMTTLYQYVYRGGHLEHSLVHIWQQQYQQVESSDLLLQVRDVRYTGKGW